MTSEDCSLLKVNIITQAVSHTIHSKMDDIMLHGLHFILLFQHYITFSKHKIAFTSSSLSFTTSEDCQGSLPRLIPHTHTHGRSWHHRLLLLSPPPTATIALTVTDIVMATVKAW